MINSKQKLNKLVAWIRKTAPKKHGLLVPISGGSDSALCFWLCTQARPDTLAVFAGDNLRAEKWFKKVGNVKKIEPPKKNENPEIARWAKFLELNLKEKRVLVGTRNRTEDVLGTYSLASRVAAYFPIVGLWKSEVLELCEYTGVPDEITASSRRADPACGRPEKLVDIPLALIDAFLKVQEGELSQKTLNVLSTAQLSYLEMLFAQNEFKKSLPTKGPFVS